MRRLSCLLVFVSLSATLADDWPQFRGPTGEGHAPGKSLPAQWSPTKNVTWKQTIPGLGWSSPVVVAGKVYLTTAVEDEGSADLSLRALCLDANDGKIFWNVEVFRQDGKAAPAIHSKNSHASPTPVVHKNRLYVHFGHQGIACVDLTGKVVWRNRELTYAPVHGNGGSPIIVDDMLVFSRDGATIRELVALDLASGKIKWKSPRTGRASRNFSFSTPLVISVNGKRQIISPASDMVASYDPKTGKEIWKVRYKGYSVIPRPVFGHGLVFICTGYESPSLLAIRPDGKGDVTASHVVWTQRRGAPHTPSPLLVGDELVMVSDAGSASCVDARTGKVHWQQRLGGRGYSASPIYAAGHIYFQSEDGVGTVLKPGKTFEMVARNEMDERTLASFAVADSSLFIRTAGRLYRIGK
jgi:outer membrane protein assembly factor BamB